MNRRSDKLTAIAAALLVGAAAWSYGFMADRREAAASAESSLDRSRSVAARIEQLRRRPNLATDQQRLTAETTGIIELAARSAGIRTDKLVRITPEPARRVGDTVYKEKPTQVLLRNVTLQQLTGMTYKLSDRLKPLHPQSIRLSAPRAEDSGGLWTAELVLTYLIYDPPKSGR